MSTLADEWSSLYARGQEGTAPAAVAAEEAAAAMAQEEAPAEGGLVDIASILGAPTVTIVRSNL
jgi:predicted secreted protein